MGRDHARGLEAGLDRQHPGEASQEESRADHQHEGKRDLGRDEPGEEALLTRARAFSAVAAGEVVEEPRIGEVGRGSEAEEEAGDEGDAEREQEHAPVASHLLQPGKTRGHEPQERAGQGRGEQQGEPAPEDREQRALGEGLAHDAGPRRAERPPDRDLAVAGRGPGQEQAADVDAGDEEHDADRAQQEHEAAAVVADHLLVERDEPQRPPRGGRVVDRVLLAQAAREDLEPGPRLVQGEPGLEPADRPRQHPLGADGGHGERRRVEAGGDEHVGVVLEALARVPELGGQHADHRVEVRVEPHRLAEHAGIGAVEPAPEAVADHRAFVETGAPIGPRERAAERGADAEHLEVAGAHAEGFDALGFLAAREVGVDRPGHGHVGEHARALLQVFELGRGHPDVGEIEAGQVVLHGHELLRARVGERAQEHGVHDREERGVGADSDAEGEDGDGGEARRPQKPA
jgi:hypothetical protein